MAFMEASRPTKSGMMERGNMTTSRRGMTGRKDWVAVSGIGNLEKAAGKGRRDNAIRSGKEGGKAAASGSLFFRAGLRAVGIEQHRRLALVDDRLIDQTLADIRHGRQPVHDIKHGAFHDVA